MQRHRGTKKRQKIKVVKKPWGKEIWIAQSPKYLGKIIFINKGCRLSKQYHIKKHETFFCDSGRCIVEINGRKKLLKRGQAIVIPPKTVHRVIACYTAVKLFEVSTPHPFDVVRLSDDYGRIK